MGMTIEQMKETAINRMKELSIYKPYIAAFKNKDTVTMFENFGGYWATKENGNSELEAKIREYEAESGNLVYAVTHEMTGFGELYDMLFVSPDEEADDPGLVTEGGITYTYAWVWNKSDEWCSEVGEIGVQSMGGGIRRCV